MAVKKEKAKPTDIYTPEVLEKRRRYLFNICESKEELQAFIKAFLKVDVPNYTVDPISNSNPMQFIWEVYRTMATNKGPKSHVVAASRNSMKTLNSAIVHFLGMVHFRRNSVHMAAIKQQSRKCIKYLKKFLKIPELAEYFETNTTFEFGLNNLPPTSYTDKIDAEIVVIAGTMDGSNSQRGNLCIFDELDLVDKEILAEAAMIGDPDVNQFDPIYISLSSRKTNSGPIQDKIDQAEKEENKEFIRLHKWNVVDFLKHCPESTHGPHNQEVYISDATLQVIWKQEGQEVDQSVKDNFRQILAYEGCKTCPVFIVCQAKAPNQKSTSKGLRTISYVGDLLRETNSVPKIKAQLLNQEPESEGLVFGLISKDVHLVKPLILFKKMFGVDWEIYAVVNKIDRKTPSKIDIYRAAEKFKWKCHIGVDWGYKDPAVSATVLYHPNTKMTVILDVKHSSVEQKYANNQWAKYIIDNVANKFVPDLICPDMADAGSATYFTPDGFQVYPKKPARIETGISQVRSLIWDPTTQQANFFIADYDDESTWAFDCMRKYKHPSTPSGGFNMEKFDDPEHDHFPDAVRYALEPFRARSEASIISRQEKPATDNVSSVMQAVNQTYRDAGAHIPDIMGDAILQAYRDAGLEKHIVDDPGISKKADKKKSSFKFSF